MREWPLIVACFLDLLGFTMLIPDLQLRAEKMGASGMLIGFIIASTFLTQTLVSPFWGRLSDRIGRKPVFVGCTLISAGSMLAYGLAGNVWLILASRILAGLGSANVAVAQAAIADGSDQAARTARLGRLSAAMSAGMIIGPAVGGYAAKWFGSDMLGYVGAVVSAYGALAVLAFAKFAPVISEKQADDAPRRKFAIVRDFPALLPLIVVAGVAWFSLSTLEGTFGRLLKANWGYDSDVFGTIFSFESVIGLVVQGLLLGWLTKRFSDRALLVTGYVLQGVGLGLTPFAPGLAAIFVFSGLYAFGVGLANPTVSGLCSKAVPEHRQGEMFGVLQGARGIGFALGPIIGGALFDWRPESPYLLAGFVSVCAAVLVWRWAKSVQTSPVATAN